MVYAEQVDTKVTESITALHAACSQGHSQVVAVLLSAGAKPEITDNEGNTALHFAAVG